MPTNDSSHTLSNHTNEARPLSGASNDFPRHFFRPLESHISDLSLDNFRTETSTLNEPCPPASTPLTSTPAPAPAQRPKPPARWKAAIAGWYLEILWCLVSVACFCALTVVLRRFNGQPLPKWRYGLTINTAVAFLSTISRAGFVIAVSESVSQLKWLWHRRERPLVDFQAFDEASRGPWGSLKLLVVMRTKAW